MRIDLSPQRGDRALVVTKSGDALTINGEVFDFSSVPDGATIPAGHVPCEWISGPVERIGGDLHITLILPHGPSPEIWQSHPDAIAMADDGPLDLPVDTVIEQSSVSVAGGVNLVTTTRRWHQPDEVETLYIPDPPPAPQNDEEADHVDA